MTPEHEQGPDTITNALPLCFDCHARVHRYNDNHPRGTKYFREELLARRDQVYEEFTRPLVPPVICEITQALPNGKARQLPDVGFFLRHCGDVLPVKVLITVSVTGVALKGAHYSGQRPWRLNPRHTISAHFPTPKKHYPRRVSILVNYSIIDALGYEHRQLPVQYIHVKKGNFWYLEP